MRWNPAPNNAFCQWLADLVNGVRHPPLSYEREKMIADMNLALNTEIKRAWREDAADRLEDACGLNPQAVIGGATGINRDSLPWWKNAAAPES